jgi:CrcB protein
MLWAIAAAGALGAVARYLLDGLVQDRFEGVFPLGTFVVNITGSFALGIVAGLVLYHGLDVDAKLVVGTGFLGSYTTFSTYVFETMQLLLSGSRLEATANLVGSVAAGLLAAAAGLTLASL